MYKKTICTHAESNWFGPLSVVTQCNTDNGIFQGDVVVTNQSEGDAFGALCYSEVNGNLLVGTTLENDINSISPLNKINLANQLYIYGTQLSSLAGINLMNTLLKFYVVENNSIKNFTVLGAIEILGVSNNDAVVLL